jgi:predicted hydrocarbon binding protein
MTRIGVSEGGSYGHSFRHNYYDPEDFFIRDESTGEIRRRDGERLITVSEDLVAALMAGTAEEVGEDASKAILYLAGHEWAMKDMANFQPNLEKEFGNVPLGEMHLNFVLETWWWPLTTTGWGGWKFDFEHRKQGLIFVELYDSVVAKSLEQIGRPVCYLYAGLFGGLFSHLSRRELNCIEIQCYASGYDVCKFMIGLDKRVNAASFWVQEGATAKEIMNKLLD